MSRFANAGPTPAQKIENAASDRDEAQAEYLAARNAHRASGAAVEPASLGKLRSRYLLAQSEYSRIRAAAWPGNASNGLPRGCETNENQAGNPPATETGD